MTAALAGRVPERPLLDALEGLRLWDVLDFQQGNPGLVATYQAVATAAPRGRRPSLSLYVQSLHGERLQAMTRSLDPSKWLGVGKHPDLILKLRICEPDSIQRRIKGLSEGARALLDWARSVGGVVTQDQFYSRGGPWAAGSRRPAAGKDPLQELERAGLLIPNLDVYHFSLERGVPEEVEAAITGRGVFDGPLTLPLLQPARSVTNERHPSPLGVVRDMAHAMGFIGSGRCEWTQEGVPYQRSLKALGKALGNAIAQYPAMLYNVVVDTGLMEIGDTGTGYKTIAVNHELPPAMTFRTALSAWQDRESLYERSEPQPRTHILEFLMHCPPDTWMTRASFLSCLQFLWPMEFDPEFTDPRPLDGLWPELSVLVLATGRSDAGEAVLLPSLVQTLLTETNEKANGAMPPWDLHVVIQPDRSVVAPPNAAPEILAALWSVTDLEGNHGASLFRISTASVTRALNNTWSPDQVLKFLGTISQGPLPDTVTRLIQDQRSRYGAVKVGASDAYLRVDDEALLDQIVNHVKLKALPWRVVAPGVAVVSGCDQGTLLQKLRSAGYVPVEDKALKREPERLPANSHRTSAKAGGRRG